MPVSHHRRVQGGEVWDTLTTYERNLGFSYPLVKSNHTVTAKYASTTDSGVVMFSGDSSFTANKAVAANDKRLSNARIPTGSAGGDLSGTFPNPTIGSNKIDSTKIIDGSISHNDLGSNVIQTSNILNGAVTLPKLNGSDTTTTDVGAVRLVTTMGSGKISSTLLPVVDSVRGSYISDSAKKNLGNLTPGAHAESIAVFSTTANKVKATQLRIQGDTVLSTAMRINRLQLRGVKDSGKVNCGEMVYDSARRQIMFRGYDCISYIPFGNGSSITFDTATTLAYKIFKPGDSLKRVNATPSASGEKNVTYHQSYIRFDSILYARHDTIKPGNSVKIFASGVFRGYSTVNRNTLNPPNGFLQHIAVEISKDSLNKRQDSVERKGGKLLDAKLNPTGFVIPDKANSAEANEQKDMANLWAWKTYSTGDRGTRNGNLSSIGDSNTFRDRPWRLDGDLMLQFFSGTRTNPKVRWVLTVTATYLSIVTDVGFTDESVTLVGYSALFNYNDSLKNYNNKVLRLGMYKPTSTHYAFYDSLTDFYAQRGTVTKEVPFVEPVDNVSYAEIAGGATALVAAGESGEYDERYEASAVAMEHSVVVSDSSGHIDNDYVDSTHYTTHFYVDSSVAYAPNSVKQYKNGFGKFVTLRGDSLETNTKLALGTRALTASNGDNSDTIATTAFVKRQSYLTGNQSISLTGDVTGSGTTSIATTLGTATVTTGTIRDTTIQVKDIKDTTSVGGNSKVVITNPSTGKLNASLMPSFSGDVTSTAGSTVTTLANSGVAEGSYTNANITIDAKGRITAASDGGGLSDTITDGAMLFADSHNISGDYPNLWYDKDKGTLYVESDRGSYPSNSVFGFVTDKIMRVRANGDPEWRSDYNVDGYGLHINSYNDDIGEFRPMYLEGSEVDVYASGEVHSFQSDGLHLATGGITYPDGTIQTTAPQITRRDTIVRGNQSGSLRATTFNNIAAGMYRISFTLICTSVGGSPGSGTVTASFSWNDGTATRTVTSASVSLASTSNWTNEISGNQNASAVSYAGSGTFTWATTLTGSAGTSKYQVAISLERLF